MDWFLWLCWWWRMSDEGNRLDQGPLLFGQWPQGLWQHHFHLFWLCGLFLSAWLWEGRWRYGSSVCPDWRLRAYQWWTLWALGLELPSAVSSTSSELQVRR